MEIKVDFLQKFEKKSEKNLKNLSPFAIIEENHYNSLYE